MTKSLHSEVRFLHAGDILFVNFKFMFVTYGMSTIHDISKQGMYGLFSNKKMRKTCSW